MKTLSIDLPEPVAAEVERRALSRGATVASFVVDLVRQHVQPGLDWPEGYFEKVVGGWQGDRLERPEQVPSEERDSF